MRIVRLNNLFGWVEIVVGVAEQWLCYAVVRQNYEHLGLTNPENR